MRQMRKVSLEFPIKIFLINTIENDVLTFRPMIFGNFGLKCGKKGLVTFTFVQCLVSARAL